MKDHSKNILIVLLFASVVGLVCFFAGSYVVIAKTASYLVDTGIAYMKENNVSIFAKSLIYDRGTMIFIVADMLTKGCNYKVSAPGYFPNMTR